MIRFKEKGILFLDDRVFKYLLLFLIIYNFFYRNFFITVKVKSKILCKIFINT